VRSFCRPSSSCSSATLAIGSGAALRSTEYDETYTRLVTSPVPRPAWPSVPFTPAEVAPVLEATVGAAETAANLRDTDVHPPLYFWLAGALRETGGTSVEALRALSVALSVGAVAAFMGAAWVAGLPVALVGLMTTLAYGFGYTGGVARGFALSHLLVGLATLAAVLAWRRGSAGLAAAAGLAGGLASFSNYLAAFPAAAVIGWLLISPGPFLARLRCCSPHRCRSCSSRLGISGSSSRSGIRGPSSSSPSPSVPALQLLGQFNAANLFGGLPLYAEGLLGSGWRQGWSGCSAWPRWRSPRAGARSGRRAGSGWAASSRPRRGCCCSAPPSATRRSSSATSPSPRRSPRRSSPARRRPCRGGSRCRPRAAARRAARRDHGHGAPSATQQAYRDALAVLAPSLGPDTLLLVPHGNDGVGIVGAVLAEAPPGQPLLVLREAEAGALPAQAVRFSRLVLLGITDRDGERQVARAREVLAGDPDWREAATPWRDARRGFSATVFEPAVESGSRVAHRPEGVVVGGAHDGREQP
jgi:hypothetical protein